MDPAVDPAWSKIESCLAGGAAPSFTYHRFWAQADIALAMGPYAELLEQFALPLRGASSGGPHPHWGPHVVPGRGSSLSRRRPQGSCRRSGPVRRPCG
ncbi:glycoside hydrolase family 48 protein [Streptomyces sp. NPDC005209]|uniref:glycoside hydrolase family 48 protein n=1 Tax=Streptomyces sp. NPDC005209 TaxID=3156715 RepID=UPI0033B3BDF0